MPAETLLQSADPRAALEELQGQIRANPADPALRTFLFQLLVTLGDWSRALTQLETVGGMDDGALGMVEVYRDVINCEKHRQAVFEGKVKPLIFGDPEPWLAHLVEAQQAFARGDYENFTKLNEEAFENAESCSGKINDEPFEWLADADQRFGPVFEVIFNQHYYWVPVSRVRKIAVEEPSDLRDLVWSPAEITWVNGGQNIVMMPTRYPNLSDASGEDLMSRRTDWRELADGVFEGLGQKMFATDVEEYPFLQVRSIEFDE
jgi:type VI secretion system protein ImpE